MMNLGGGEILIIVVIIASWILPILAIIDASTQPESSYEAIGSSKVTQVAVLAVSAILCGPVGTVLALIYLVSTRRKLRATPAGA
jgi:hypothetical protein